MYPHERSLVKRLQNSPFALLGVNSDQDREKLRATLEDENITWRSWWDGGDTGSPIATQWKVSYYPTIYVLDHEGRIRYADVRGADMDRAVDTLLEEMGHDPPPVEKEGKAASP